MAHRTTASVVASAGIVVLVLGATPASGQTPAAAPKTPAGTAGEKSRTVLKTPWGDPDLQGTWTTDSAGIPMQRPQQFAGRAELNDEEFKAKSRARQSRRGRTPLNAAGSIRGDGAWLDKTFRQTSLIVEPADGKLPPLTPEAERKRALRPAAPTATARSTARKISRSTIAASRLGVVGSLTPKIYGNGHRIIQAPGYVAIMNEMIHETRVIPLDGRPHPGKTSRCTWATAAATGRATRW